MIIIKNIEERIEDEKVIAKHRNFDQLVIEEVKDFVEKAINMYGTEEKLEEANRVTDRLIATYKFRGLINSNVNQSFVDLQIAASLLHNLFYCEDDWRTLVNARYYLEAIREEIDMHPQAFDGICKSIECQLGNDTPVPDLRPNPNTPQELFADILFQEKTYLPIK